MIYCIKKLCNKLCTVKRLENAISCVLAQNWFFSYF